MEADVDIGEAMALDGIPSSSKRTMCRGKLNGLDSTSVQPTNNSVYVASSIKVVASAVPTDSNFGQTEIKKWQDQAEKILRLEDENSKASQRQEEQEQEIIRLKKMIEHQAHEILELKNENSEAHKKKDDQALEILRLKEENAEANKKDEEKAQELQECQEEINRLLQRQHDLSSQSKRMLRKLDKQNRETLLHKCFICLENERQIVCGPCGHFGICSGCCSRLPNQKCPMCRRDMTHKTKLYYV